MKTIMRLSSSSGKEFIDVVKDDENYILQNQHGAMMIKRNKEDEDGMRSLMDYINDLTNIYGWVEKRL